MSKKKKSGNSNHSGHPGSSPKALCNQNHTADIRTKKTKKEKNRADQENTRKAGQNNEIKTGAASLPSCPLPPLREVIKRHDLQARKTFGQNFLLDRNLTDKIARSADIRGRNVIEIGPGPGGLTASLLQQGASKVSVIEIDLRIIPIMQELQDSFGPHRLEIIEGDALTFDYSLFPDQSAIVANLPYNIATPLLTGWLALLHKNPNAFSSLTLMFQKEVAQRITARPSTRHYGRLSVLCQWLCSCRTLLELPPAAFTPPPKVTSTVVQLIPLRKNHSDRFLKENIEPGSTPGKCPQPALATVEKITALAFGQRRKMLRSSLSKYRDLLADLMIDDSLRAENLGVEDFIALASAADQLSL